MKPAPFRYRRANDLDEALALLSEAGEEGKLLAGGQSLIAMMNLRLARPEVLVDIGGLRGLSHVRSHAGGLRVGALVRHRQLEHYPAPMGGFDVLRRAARLIGHVPIRARGTFGGSLAHADGAAEWCLLALLLEAEIVVAGPGGIRSIRASEFFLGTFTTALEPDEMILEVRLPPPPGRSALVEFARRHGDFAIVAACSAFDVVDGRIRRPRVVLGGVANRPVLAARAAALLEGAEPGAEIFVEVGRVAASEIDPPTDVHGSGEYRRRLAATLVGRSLANASATPTDTGLGGAA